MNEFSYIDIFATKGFEYLLVIGFFLLLAAFWSFLNVPKKEVRKAQAEREELRRLLDLQHERMEGEIGNLREQRDNMQSALLAQLQLLEHRAVAAWHEAQPDADPPTLVQLFDWLLVQHDMLARDQKRLDFLADLGQGKASLYRTSEPDRLVVVDVAGKGFGEGSTLRGAIDAARSQRPGSGSTDVVA